MDLSQINTNQIYKFFLTIIYLLIKPSKSLVFSNKTKQVTSIFGISSFGFWFWSTLFSSLLTLTLSSFFTNNEFKEVITSSIFIFFYSVVRLIWVALLYYSILIFLQKIKFLPNDFFNQFFGSYLFSIGISTILTSIVFIPLIAKSNLLDKLLTNDIISDLSDYKQIYKSVFIIFLIGILSIIYFVIYSKSLLKLKLSEDKIVLTIIIFLISYALTRPIVSIILNETMYFVRNMLIH